MTTFNLSIDDFVKLTHSYEEYLKSTKNIEVTWDEFIIYAEEYSATKAIDVISTKTVINQNENYYNQKVGNAN